jgi:hypothetical protein
MALTEQQKLDYLNEIFDSSKVNLKCGRHLYFGPIKGKPEITPVEGCVDCWTVFYIYELASIPANERRQKLEEIEEVLHNTVQLVESGQWDLKMYPHAKIEINGDDPQA